MAIKTNIIAGAIGAVLAVPFSLAPAAPALASFATGCDSPQAHAAHPAWFRPGGYCAVSADTRDHVGFEQGGGAVGSFASPGGCGCAIRVYDLNYGGYHYHDNGGGNWTVSNGSSTYTFQYHGDGTYTRTP